MFEWHRGKSRLTVAVAVTLAWMGLSTACADEPELGAPQNSFVDVRAYRVRAGTARHWVYGQGTIRAVRREILTFEVDGRVAFIADTEDGRRLQVGDEVRGPSEDQSYGQLLLSLDNREQAAEVASSEAALREVRERQTEGGADLKSAGAELRTAKTEYERTRALVGAGALAQTDLDAAKLRFDSAESAILVARSRTRSSRSSTQAQAAALTRTQIGLEKASIFAPFDGVISYLNVEEGDYYFNSTLSGHTTEERLRLAPIVVIDPSEFELTVQLPAFEARDVARGQTAVLLTGSQVAMASTGEQPILGPDTDLVFAEVYAVSPSIDPQSRTTEVLLRTVSGAAQLRDGEFVTCWIITQVSDSGLLLPFDALIERESGPLTFVIDESTGTVDLHPLTLGIRDMSGVEVVAGLSAGDLVVTDGRHALSVGAQVEVAEIDEPTLPLQREGGQTP